MLERIEKSLFAIKTKLLTDDVIKQLLYNDANNALELPVPTKEQADKYITLCPIFEFENKQDYEQNGMVNLVVTDLSTDNDQTIVSGVLLVSVVINVDKWVLINNKIRPLSLSNRIIEILNKQKFNISNSLELSSINQLIISKKLVGYALSFDITDGNGKINNF